MKPAHVVLGTLGTLLVGYLILKPAGASPPPPATLQPKVPVTAADLGKTLQVDFTNFKMTAFTNAPGHIELAPSPPAGVGPFRLLGGSINPTTGAFSRVDGSFTFADGSIMLGSVPPEAVLSIGTFSVVPALPSVPFIPAGFFPDLAVGDIILVDAKKANLPVMTGDFLGQLLMKVDLIMTDKTLVSAATYPVKTFSGTIPRNAILQLIPSTPPVISI